MLEYIFFESRFRDRFTDELNTMQVRFELAGADEELLVLVDEDIDEELEEQVESLYEQLMNEQASSVNDQEAADESIHVVGVQYTATDGTVCQVRLPPALVNRITQCLSNEELQQLVQTIADDVSNPDLRPLCEK
jgi:hypothetical protein